MLSPLIQRWHGEGGYREVLFIAIPLILSTGSLTIQHFVDRMFLTWHSTEAIAAAMPAGIVNFTFMSIFIGTTTYVNTFVAQYWGAKQYKRIGPAVWQGLYFSLFAGLIILPLYPLASRIFALAGHDLNVQQLEINYFQILIFAGLPVTASSALAGFFSGRGKTKTVMWVTFVSTGVNIILDYGLIFGNLGLPSMGIKGAALATVISQFVRLAIYLLLLFRPSYEKQYRVLSGWKPDKELFIRLLRFGFPNGLHYFLEMTGFTFFIMLAGKLGTIPLAATNITFNINHLAFMPMIGFGMGLSILVGKRLGENRPSIAQRSTWSTFHLAFLYMSIIAAAYAFVPKLFLIPYAIKSNPQQFELIASLSINMLKFVALYSLFDTMNIIFAAAIKGAGDTRFVMGISVLLSWILMVIPSYIFIIVLKKGIYTIWGCATFYISIMGLVFLLRFLGGKWKTMRVIENYPEQSNGWFPPIKQQAQPGPHTET
jgi:MATE family multidrug resistance protein